MGVASVSFNTMIEVIARVIILVGGCTVSRLHDTKGSGDLRVRSRLRTAEIVPPIMSESVREVSESLKNKAFTLNSVRVMSELSNPHQSPPNPPCGER
jgi:hypothetical protein